MSYFDLHQYTHEIFKCHPYSICLSVFELFGKQVWPKSQWCNEFINPGATLGLLQETVKVHQTTKGDNLRIKNCLAAVCCIIMQASCCLITSNNFISEFLEYFINSDFTHPFFILPIKTSPDVSGDSRNCFFSVFSLPVIYFCLKQLDRKKGNISIGDFDIVLCTTEMQEALYSWRQYLKNIYPSTETCK